MQGGNHGPGRRCSAGDAPRGFRLGRLTSRLGLWGVKDPCCGDPLRLGEHCSFSYVFSPPRSHSLVPVAYICVWWVPELPLCGLLETHPISWVRGWSRRPCQGDRARWGGAWIWTHQSERKLRLPPWHSDCCRHQKDRPAPHPCWVFGALF